MHVWRKRVHLFRRPKSVWFCSHNLSSKLPPLLFLHVCAAYPHATQRFCETNGLTEVTGDCLAGYYCTTGAILRNPVDQTYGDLCTAGHYCEEGSPWPQPCPLGTYYGAEVLFEEYRPSV